MSRLYEAREKMRNLAMGAMTALGIPSQFEDCEAYYPSRKEFGYMIGLTQEEVLGTDVNPMLNLGPIGEIGHPVRVAVMSTVISRMLDFSRDARIEYFLLGTSHDLGKLKVSNYYPEKNHYQNGSRNYLEFIDKFKHGHVNPKNVPRHWGKRVSSASESSHRHQKNTCRNEPYPKKFVFPQTRGSYLLSQLIAIPDFIDAISSRPCKITGNHHTPEEIIELAQKEYGDMRLVYKGNLFPRLDINGREIIQELQKTGFAGRTRPSDISKEDFRINPFGGLEIK